MRFQPTTIRELLDWSYANLAAYQLALAQKPPAYTKVCWMTRTRVYKGLQAGKMTRQSLYKNEREKLAHKDMCSYCGATGFPLTLDHLFAKSRSGGDSGDNLVYCCQSCNSSKRNRDYFEWGKATGRPVSVAIAERYLKNAYSYCLQNDLLDFSLSSAPPDLPFSPKDIPLRYEIS